MYHRSDEFRTALHSIDYKFLLIPLLFVFLRLWSFVEDILYVYLGVRDVPEAPAVALKLLGVSSGHFICFYLLGGGIFYLLKCVICECEVA